jgi:hypothetical protein
MVMILALPFAARDARFGAIYIYAMFLYMDLESEMTSTFLHWGGTPPRLKSNPIHPLYIYSLFNHN